MENSYQRETINNPFRPGAGHMPPYLAGRQAETAEFSRMLDQDLILQNVVLTGLRGLGKTVLLETFKPMALAKGWAWVGTDLSESTSISEDALAVRLLTDLSVVTSNIIVARKETPKIGFTLEVDQTLNYDFLSGIYSRSPGLVSDKLKAVFETVWAYMKNAGRRGVIFAYDEAQNMADHAKRNQYPLSLLLDIFQSIQRKEIPFMLVLTGLPTLFPKLVEARTYSERMFKVIFLEKLDEQSSADAMTKPVNDANSPITFTDASIKSIYTVTAGYPYFIQYVCREVFDIWVQHWRTNGPPFPTVKLDAIVRKLDCDFFAGRWAKATDRQRQLLYVVACLNTDNSEFTVQEVVEFSEKTQNGKPFSSSYCNQLLAQLGEAGLVYKNRHGKYSFAVPLMAQFIKRTFEQEKPLPMFSNLS